MVSVEFRLKLSISRSTEQSVEDCRSLWNDVRVTRGQVDNENNSQSQYSNMSNTYMNESLIYEIERHSQGWGYQKCEQQCDVTGIRDTG